MIDITNEDLKKSYKQVRNELANYSKELTIKKELVVFNKIDLLKDKDIKSIKEDFLKSFNVDIVTLSTLNKESVSKIKLKLISYVY